MDTVLRTRNFAQRFGHWLAVLVSCLGIGFAQAATFTVNSNADAAADGTCSTGASAPTSCTLRDAIDLANATDATDTIMFAPSLIGTLGTTITLTSGGNTVTRSLVINGPGAKLLTINGNLSRIFLVDDGTTAIRNVTLKGMTLFNGSTGSTGGAVDNAEQLTIDGCAIRFSQAQYGGGIYSAGAGSRLIVRNSTISNNAATDNGGGIYVATTNSNGIQGLLIENSTIGPLNTATNFHGGGIYLDAPASPVLIDKSTIIGNTAKENGGGLYVNAPTGEAPILVRSTTISGNVANSTTGTTGGGGGAYIFDPTTTVTFENSTLSGNKADHENGGGLFVFDTTGGGGASANNTNALLTRLRNTTVVKNTAPDNGGGGPAGSKGGGIWNMSDIILQNVLVADNTGDNGNLDDVDSDDNSDDNVFSEYSLFETGDGSITDLPGGGNIQDVFNFTGLDVLAYYGGSRQTHAIKVEGQETVVDRGGNSPCLRPNVRNFDGRGALRPVDGDEDTIKTCDMGAVEFNGKVKPCPAVPAVGCALAGTGSQLTFTKGATATANKLAITFTALPLADNLEFFGRPTAFDGTSNSFCVYADSDGTLGTRELVASAVLEAGERNKAGTVLWKRTDSATAGNTTYANTLGNADGVRTVAQIAGATSSSKMTAQGATSPLPDLPLSLPTAGVLVQNQLSNGNCAQVTFDTGNDVITNTATKADLKVVP